MLSNECQPLGGEEWPAADIGESAENRNNYGVLNVRPLQLRAVPSRTLQEQAGTVGTKSTQQTEFEFAMCSRTCGPNQRKANG